MVTAICLLNLKHQVLQQAYKGACIYYDKNSPVQQAIARKLAHSVIQIYPSKLEGLPKLRLSSGQEVSGSAPVEAVLAF